MIKAAVVGASGYTGAELVRLLTFHPQVELKAITSESYAGQSLSDLYPGLHHAGDQRLTKLADTPLDPEQVDVVFLGLPHGESMILTPKIAATGVKVIDLSGDFRFHDTKVYEQWYQREHTAAAAAAEAVYGLPELFRQTIKPARFVANPGCYVTATVLALYPLLRHGLVEAQTLIADAKSGISGAGRKAKPETMFNRISENVIPYKVGGQHQHTPEMEQALSLATAQEVKLSFTPQMVPAKRGILTTVYARLRQPRSVKDIEQIYQESYAQEPFIRLRLAQASWPDLTMAVGSNLCVIKTTVDERTGMVITVAAMDNLIKGASGQAIQNMNLMFGLEETMGLPQEGIIP